MAGSEKGSKEIMLGDSSVAVPCIQQCLVA
jgi:hypothetical protein